jgi:iron(III) transport system permease protein
MVDQIAQESAGPGGPARRLVRRGRRRRGARAPAGLLGPLDRARRGGGDIWPHLLSTTLPRYVGNTLVLMVGVGALTAAVGTGAAWLVTMYRFLGAAGCNGRSSSPRVPRLCGAYALVDFLEYAGPVQTGLRALFGWETARDYRFPEIRTAACAILVLSGALYPYVYSLPRRLPRAVGRGFEVARALGGGPWRGSGAWACRSPRPPSPPARRS